MAKMPTFFLFDDFDLGVVELIHQRIGQITLLAGEFPHKKPIETEESTCIQLEFLSKPWRTKSFRMAVPKVRRATVSGETTRKIWWWFQQQKKLALTHDLCGVHWGLLWHQTLR